MLLERYNLTLDSDEGTVNQNIINNFEKKIGYKFPETYKQIISQHNLLRIEQDAFKFINFYNEKDIGGCAFFGYGTPTENITEANTHFEDPEYYGEKGIIAFGREGNGDNVCFDYRDDLSTDNPKIVYVYHDRFEETRWTCKKCHKPCC